MQADNPEPEDGCEPAIDAIVAAWCLEGDASVLLPQMRRRLEPPAAVELSGVAPIEWSEAAIAKRLAAAVVRKIRASGMSNVNGSPLLAAASSTHFDDTTTVAGLFGGQCAAAAKGTITRPGAVVASPVDDRSVGSPRDDVGHEEFSTSALFPLLGERAPAPVAAADRLSLFSAARVSPPPHRIDATMVSGWAGTPPGADLNPFASSNSSTQRHGDDGGFFVDGGAATLPPSASPSHLVLGSPSDSKFRKDLTRALTDVWRGLLSTSRQLVSATKESVAIAARAEVLEAALEAAQARAARLEMELLDAKQPHRQWPPQRGSRRVSLVLDEPHAIALTPPLRAHREPALLSGDVPPRLVCDSNDDPSVVPRFPHDADFTPSTRADEASAARSEAQSRVSNGGASDDMVCAGSTAAPIRPPPALDRLFSFERHRSVGIHARPPSGSSQNSAGDLSRTHSTVNLHTPLSNRSMVNMLHALATIHHDRGGDGQHAPPTPSRFRHRFRPPSTESTSEGVTLNAEDLICPTVRTPLTTKGSAVFESVRDPVRMQQRAEESIDDIGMPMLNQYVILSELGAGSQGTVNLALDTETEELRAIKVIARPIATSGVGLRMQRANQLKLAQLQREVAILKGCRHRNVVALYEVIDDPEADSMYLVMQYVQKGSLAKQTATGETTPIDGATLASYAKQLCSGLQYLHSRGIVHRDVKPENILLGANGVVYLSDFGISSVDETSGLQTPRRGLLASNASFSNAEVSGSGEYCHPSPAPRGTAAFLAPEVISGYASTRSSPLSTPSERATCADDVHAAPTNIAPLGDTKPQKWHADGCAADVWALGMSLYVMLYGQLPWPATKTVDFLENVTSAAAAIPYPATTREGQPISKHNEWAFLLSKMICRDVNQRMTAADAYVTARALLREYEAAAAAAVVGDDAPLADDDVQRALTAVWR